MKKLDNIQKDAIREVSNIGSGHAATALSELTGQKVAINVPVINIEPLSEVFLRCSGSGRKILGIRIDLSGDIVGRTLLFFAQEDAVRFCNCLMRRPVASGGELSELDRSGLREVSNILTCAYMNALGELLGFMVIPTTPTLISGPSGDLLAALDGPAGGEELAVIIENEFRFQGSETSLKGYFLLLPDDDSLQAMFKAMNIK